MASSSGATIYIHQCMGKTISWDIVEKEASKCTKCGMHKNAPGDCCNDHVKVLKLNNQNFTKITIDRIFTPALAPHETYTFLEPAITAADIKGLQTYIPPNIRPDLCIYYCVFLI